MKLTELYLQIIGDKLLTEAKHKYGCVMLYFPVPMKFWDNIQSRLNDDDISSEVDENGEEKNGRQSADEAHVTLLYGYTDTLPDKDVEEIISKFEPIEITLRKISTFDKDDCDVLKFDVEGDELFNYNKLLSELPNETDFPKYHPHLTIAFVKKGKLTPEMKKDLTGDDILVVTSNKVVYSKPDGSKKEYDL